MRAESRVELASAAAREALHILAHADALERFLAEKFPATKVHVGALFSDIKFLQTAHQDCRSWME